VLLPVRNAQEWLDECLRSLAAQTFADFEVLAVDDGSTDGSRQVLDRWAAQDARIRVLSPAPAGEAGDLVRALEHGRADARGELLARMDADDVASVDRFAAQVALLDAQPSIVLCGTAVRAAPRGSMTDGSRRYERWLNGLTTPAAIDADLFVECPIAHPTFLLRARALADLGGYRAGPFPEDYDLILRLWRTGGRFGQAECGPLVWRDHPARLQRQDPRYALDAFQSLKVDHLLATHLQNGRSTVIWGAGPTGKAFARLLADRGHPTEAFVDLDPRKIGQTIHGAQVLAPEQVGEPGGRFCLGAVAQPGARTQIRGALTAENWVETVDFRVVA